MLTISVIIPSYNRYVPLLAAIKSVHAQELPPNVRLETIVINDGSSDERYYTKKIDGVTMIHRQENTRKWLGFVSAGFVRNCGIRMSSGDYIAFLDDDDAWYPTKLKEQLALMRENKALASCTDVYYGQGTYPGKKLAVYNREMQKARLGRLPKWISASRLKKHNVLITSTVMIHKSILGKTGLFIEDKPMQAEGKGGVYEDYELWKAIAKHIDFLWIDRPLGYYDSQHGGGRHYAVK